jgi:hypothetical protein
VQKRQKKSGKKREKSGNPFLLLEIFKRQEKDFSKTEKMLKDGLMGLGKNTQIPGTNTQVSFNSQFQFANLVFDRFVFGVILLQ